MAARRIDSQTAFLLGSSDLALHRRADGAIETLPDNLLANASMSELDGSGTPLGFDLEWALERVVSYHVNASRPGTAAKPPRLKEVVRQTTAAVPLEEGSWTMEEPHVAGMKARHTSGIIPPAPTLEAVGNGSRGFRGGTYGWAWGVSTRFGPTTTTAVRPFTLLDGEIPAFPVPDMVRMPGVITWDLYMTRRNGGAATLALQRRVPVSQIRSETHRLPGPWRNRGRPPAANRSGVGIPGRPGDRAARLVDSGHNMPAGKWQHAVQLELDGGTSMLSPWGPAEKVVPSTVRVKVPGPDPADGSTSSDPPEDQGNEIRNPETREETDEPVFHWEKRDLPYKKNTSMKLRKPIYLRGKRGRGLRYTYWLRHESLSGTVTTYRVVRPGSRRGAGAYFDVPSMEVSCELPDSEATGTTSAGKRKAPRFALVQEDVPTEDTTIVEAPDPTSQPDEPTRTGQQVPAAGRYLFTVQGVLEGGGLTRPSPRGLDSSNNDYLDITTSQMPKVNLPSTLNKLKNAEFSRLDVTGKPEDWAPVNTATTQPGYYRAEGGVLTLGVTASTDVAPRLESARIPHDPESPVDLVAGTVGLNRVTAGTARVTLRQLDESGAGLGALTLVDLGSAAEVPFSGRQTLDPATASVVLVLQLAGTTVNAEAYFKNLRVLGLPVDVRYVDYGEDGATFDTQADTPLPGQSFIAVAPAPESEQPAVEEQAPYSVVGFEGGLWPASWVEVAGGAQNAIEAAAAIHEALGQRTQDTGSTNALYHRYLDVLPLGADGSSLGNRHLRRFVQLPTRGYIASDPILDQNGQILAIWRNYWNGALTLVWWTGKDYAEANITPAYAGDVLDREIVVSGAGTRNATVSASVGKNGARREVALSRFGLDWRGRSATRAVAGVTNASDRLAKWNLHLDQIAVTENGDVLDREKPKAPAGFVPPPPDRPLKPAVPTWSAKTVRTTGQEIVPTISNGHRYSAQNAGTTGPNEPTFPTAAGQSVRDNAGLAPVPDATAVSLGAAYLKPGGTLEDAEWYEVTTAGTTAAAGAHPAYPTIDGATIKDRPNQAQVDTVEITAVNATAYSVTIDGTAVSYTSDVDATEGEIAIGLVAAINNDATLSPKVTAQTSALATDAAASFTVTADVAGTAFTMSVGANLTATTTTPNIFGAVLTTRKTIVWQEAGGLYRTFDYAGRKLSQIYALVAPGAADDEGIAVDVLDEPIPVRPGVSYTLSTFSRSVPFSTGPYGARTSVLRVWAESEDASNEPYVAATIPLSPQWTEEDSYGVITVEPDYHHLRPELVFYDGVHVLQELLLPMGALTVFADRDAKRQGGRAASGTGEWVFDLRPEAYELGINPGVWVSEFGVKESPAPDDGIGTLTTTFTTSADRIDWLPYSASTDLPLRYLRMSLSLTGEASAASLYARTWMPVGVLLRPDGTHFPGVAYISMLSPSPYPDVEVSRIGGRLRLTVKSDSIERIEDQKIAVAVSTEEARREVQYLSSIGPLVAEIPHAMGTVAGQSMRLLFDGRLALEVGEVPSRIEQNVGRVLYAGGTADYAEVVEMAPMQAPMRLVDFGTPVLAPAVVGA
jgi:hypothetical protein